jgi:septum site-determining protein MinD
MMSNPQDATPSVSPRTIAVLSGKGGSGKTMLVAVMAQMFSKKIGDVIVLDADTATAGMTYYLALKLLENIRVGLSNVARNEPEPDSYFEQIKGYLQPIRGFERAKFFGIGDHRRLEREVSQNTLPSILGTVVSSVKKLSAWVFVDCRGGIDDESLAVCREADDVILICETDTTSFQATRHIVDVLSDHDQAFKIRGFIINKVFDDPTVLINQGTADFGTQFLAAIPFDFKATRSFLKGDIPQTNTPFGMHVMAALNRAYPDIMSESVKTWTIEEYREVGLSTLDSRRGGIFIASLITILGLVFTLNYFFLDPQELKYVVGFLLLGLLGSLDITRRLFGKMLEKFFSKILSED